MSQYIVNSNEDRNFIFCHICGTQADTTLKSCPNCGTILATNELSERANNLALSSTAKSDETAKDESENSRIIYFRPRGIQANYKVGIILGLLPTESVEIQRLYYPQRDSSVQKIQPTKTTPIYDLDKRLISTTYIYVLSQFACEQQLYITIKDEDVYYWQEDWYEANTDNIRNITKEQYPYFSVLREQELKKIALYDLDALGITQSLARDVTIDTMQQLFINSSNQERKQE